MADVRLTPAARSDIEDILSIGIAGFGEVVADRHLGDLRRAFALLADHPMAGQQRPEFRQDMRSISAPPHRILYTVADDIVLIVRIIHQARDVRTALGSGQ